MIFNCIPDSVTAYSIKEQTMYVGDRPETEYQVYIWWNDGREVEMVLRDPKEVEVVSQKLEQTVKTPPAVTGFSPVR